MANPFDPQGTDQAAPETAAAIVDLVEMPPRPVWSWWGALLMVLAALAAQFIAGMAAMIGVMVIGPVGFHMVSDAWVMPATNLAGSLAMLGVLLIVRRRGGARPLWDSRDVKDWRNLALAFLALVISAAANVARIFVEQDPAAPALNKEIAAMVHSRAGTPWGPLLVLGLTVVVLAPLTEEWLFRGIVLPALHRAFGPHWARLGALVAVLVSSLIFGLLHWPIWWVPAVYGAVIGTFSLRQRSLAVCFLIHGVINLTVFSLVLIGA